MKLKNYLSAKKLKKMLSKASISESHCSINDSFTDYNDNEVAQLVTSKDDMYLRPRREGGFATRTDMTQSFSGYLPSSYESQEADLSTHYGQLHKIHYDSQADLQQSDSNSCQSITSASGYPSQDNIHRQYLERISNNLPCPPGGDNYHSCNTYGVSTCNCCSSWQQHYHSLPSQTNNHIMQDIHYNSLPSSMTQSIYIGSNEATSADQQRDRRRRSRIKTNPWLPLPKENANTLRRTRNVNKRAEPRLSRFFSEVEEVMREQLASEVHAEYRQSVYSGSNESLASTCSTATEIPVGKLDDDVNTYHTLSSPSEGYKSACSNTSDLNLADTESFTDSRSSSRSDFSKNYEPLETSRSLNGHYPPSLQDFTASLNFDRNWTSSSSLLSDSMFASRYSQKYEALEDKVRKLCQSTTDLDEKMRLARLECSYIRAK